MAVGTWPLLAVMQKTGLVPNAITCNAALSTFADGGQLQQAIGLFLAVMQKASLVPNVIICNAAFSAFANSRQWQQALGLFWR